jgi:chitin synthase
MAGRPPLRAVSPHGSDHSSDPFADRPRTLQFQEPRPNSSDFTLSLPHEYGSQDRPYDEEEVEKHLPSGKVLGGFYPPG